MKMSTLEQLLQAKEHSDRRQYGPKTEIMRSLIRKLPNEFHIDSEGHGVVGLTHAPTKFKIHLPKEKVKDLDLKKVAQAKELAQKLIGAGLLGGAAVGLPMAGWYSRQQPGDPLAVDPATGKKITNMDIWKAQYAVNKALGRLGKGDFDVPDENNLNRIFIPEKKLKEPVMKYLNFSPSIIAVPEHGQDRLTTYRQTGTHAHIHHHPEGWAIHKDKWSSMSMVPKEVAAGNKDVMEAITEGVMHPAIEGTKGYMTWIKDKLQGNLTYDEIMKAKTYPEKYPGLVHRYNRELMTDNEKILKKLKLEQQAQVATKKAHVPLMVKNARLLVEVADSEEERMRGLSHRTELRDGQGMLFTKAGHFWMKDVHIPLDLIFMDKQGKVTDILHMPVEADKSSPSKLYRPAVMAKDAMALEVPAGWCTRNNVCMGDNITVAQ